MSVYVSSSSLRKPTLQDDLWWVDSRTCRSIEYFFVELPPRCPRSLTDLFVVECEPMPVGSPIQSSSLNLIEQPTHLFSKLLEVFIPPGNAASLDVCSLLEFSWQVFMKASFTWLTFIFIYSVVLIEAIPSPSTECFGLFFILVVLGFFSIDTFYNQYKVSSTSLPTEVTKVGCCLCYLSSNLRLR